MTDPIASPAESVSETTEKKKPATKAIKTDADLITKALATVRERNHGDLKSLVTRFLQLYVDNPAQVFQVIASLETGEFFSNNSLPLNSPQVPETLGDFNSLF